MKGSVIAVTRVEIAPKTRRTIQIRRALWWRQGDAAMHEEWEQVNQIFPIVDGFTLVDFYDARHRSIIEMVENIVSTWTMFACSNFIVQSTRAYTYFQNAHEVAKKRDGAAYYRAHDGSSWAIYPDTLTLPMVNPLNHRRWLDNLTSHLIRR